MTLISSLPEDIIIDCISRVPRRYYPTLSLVSKYFRSLITSHELYARRILLARTEHCLYVTISKTDSNDTDDDRLYTLRQNFNSPDKKYSLVPIFVIPDEESLSSTDTLLIDCRFHTAQHLPSMPNEVGSSVYKYSSVDVKGVELMTGEDVKLSRTVIYGEKVVVFWQKEFDEKRKFERERFGRVEWCGCVVEGEWLTLKNSLVVKV
ncbi:hypothetical protein N665_0118s0062 [Sinapis alba]|nr:hypothetical protein N665_0118s0062 [Sinapis alba]